jgi:hypothetical protein
MLTRFCCMMGEVWNDLYSHTAHTLGTAWYTISILIDICRCLAGWRLDRYRSIFSAVATFAAQIQPRFSQI